MDEKLMRILITGARGFVGRNLCAELRNIQEGNAKNYPIPFNLELFEYDVDSDLSMLDEYCGKADFVFHLAGVNRPQEPKDFMEGNFGFTSLLLESLTRHNNRCPIVLSSSTQAELNNLYGESKRAGEDLLRKYSRGTGAKILIYRFPNVFGKWCKPNYNSAVATFCHNIANGLPIKVNDPTVEMNLVYIDDLVREMIEALVSKEHINGDFAEVPKTYRIKLGEIADLVYSFKNSRENLLIPNMADEFTKKLYATYLSYLPKDKLSYPLTMHVDDRGSFTEFIKSADRGQVSVNISKPGIIKGNHWHHTKNERFCVVSGMGVIRLRKLHTDEVVEYFVSGTQLEVVDIPVGYTHTIENLGESDMVTLMWCNEIFDNNNPDTFFEKI